MGYVSFREGKGVFLIVPSWELTYPLPAGTFESMIFLFPFGGICDRFLEGSNSGVLWVVLCVLCFCVL